MIQNAGFHANVFLLLLVVIFFLMVIIYMLVNECTFKESVIAVCKGICLLCKICVLEPVPWETPGFIENVKRELKHYSSLSNEILYRDDCSVRGRYVVEFIGTQDNLHIFMIVLRRLVEVSLQVQGFTPVIDVSVEKKAPGIWHVIVLYASHRKSKKRLEDYLERKKQQEREQAANSLSAPVDKELEKECKENEQSDQSRN